jgi:predicted transcriptional regulator
MEECKRSNTKKVKSYYQRNKHKYKKGGKYYYYKSVEDRRPKIPVSINRGKFILSFD